MIFSDTARENPKEMGFGEFDVSLRGSNAHQIARVGSPPGASHCDSHSIVDHFIDITLQVGEGGSELFHLSHKILFSSDRVTNVGKICDKSFGQHFLTAEAPFTPARINIKRLPSEVVSVLCPTAATRPPPIFTESMIPIFICKIVSEMLNKRCAIVHSFSFV